MVQRLGSLLIGLEIIIISFLSIPISILGAITLSWMTHLPSAVRQEVEKEIVSVVDVVLSMLGGFLWIVMVFYMTCTKNNPEAVKVVVLAIFMALVSAAFWVVYAVATPWHPKSKLSSEVLSAPTVLTGCKEILALKCLIVVILSLLAFYILTLSIHIAVRKGIFRKSSKSLPQHTTMPTTTPSNHSAEDELSAQPESMVLVKGDLEAGTEVANMAVMDGAG